MFRNAFFAAILAAAAVTGGCHSTGGDVASWNHYGPADLDSDTPVPLGAIDQTQAGPVVVRGTIDEVCQTKGCWMVIVDGDRSARVKFKDYSFFVPRNAAGRQVVVRGWGEPTLIDVQWARHMAEDAGRSQAEIEAITEPVAVYEITAIGVYISGSGLEEPHTGG
ncbi:MAG: DUF4920 domain-containing protein [Phycisphaerales bacterium]|nr:DUF4920 domain-containing protein [Phycisphaerales bacterium]